MLRHRSLYLAAAFCTFLCALTGPASARNVVDVPTDASTIEEALTLVDEAGTIRIAEGEYAGGFTIDKSVTVQGGYPPDFAGEANPWLHPTVVLGGAGVNGANIVLSTGAVVSVTGLFCRQGQAGVDAILTGDASLNLSTVICEYNDRGLRVELHDDSQVTAIGSFLRFNGLDGSGAGIAATADGNSSLNIVGCEITDNSATSGAAGLLVEANENAAVSLVSGTLLARNGYHSGVVDAAPASIHYALNDAAALILFEARIEGNVPAQLGDAAVGGTQAIESLLQIEATQFSEGENGVGGEALDAQLTGLSSIRFLSNSFEDATGLVEPIVRILSDEQAVAHILRNRFAGCTSATSLVVSEQHGSSFMNFDGNVVRGNTTHGEALSMSVAADAGGALLRAVNCQVSENHSIEGSGGAYFQVDGPNIAQVGYNTFYRNTAQSGVAGLHLVASMSSPAEVSNNAAIENSVGGVPQDLLVEGFLADAFSNFLTGDGDPGFWDAESGNFRLAPGSLLIDAADPSAFQIDHDFEEDDRPFNEIADIGSDESTIASTGIPPSESQTVLRFQLGSPWPNPVRDHLRCPIELARVATVDYRIVEVTGRLVHGPFREELAAGSHTLEWTVDETKERLQASALLYLVVEVEGDRQSRRLVLVR